MLSTARLPVHRDAHAEIAAARHYACEHGSERGVAVLFLRAHHPRDMTLKHVAHLVTDHRRQLRLGLRRGDQARVYADETVRH